MFKQVKIISRFSTFISLCSALIFSNFTIASDETEADCYHLFSSSQYSLAKQKCQEMAELGDAKAAYFLANIYYQGLDTPQDDQRGLFWDQIAADKGFPESAYRLGLAYQLGQGVEQSNSKARNWYHQAALAKHPKAQKLLANMFESGAAGEKDLSQAYKWYMKAAQQGVADAQFKVGLMLLDGRGVEANQASAQHWIRKAANLGNANAQVALGIMLSQIDPEESLIWYELSSEQGNGVALQNLALVYYVGQGVEVDRVKAIEFAQKAVDMGNEDAASLLNLMRLEIEQKKVVELQTGKEELSQQMVDSQPEKEHEVSPVIIPSLSDDNNSPEFATGSSESKSEVVDVAVTKPSEILNIKVETPNDNVANSKSNVTESVDVANDESAERLNIKNESFEKADNKGPTKADVESEINEVSIDRDKAAEIDASQIGNPYLRNDDWILNQSPNHFTIQVLNGTEESGVIRYIEKYQLTDKGKYFPTRRGKELFYILIYGDYASFADAQLAMADLPDDVRKGLWIRQYNRLQEFYRKP